MFFHLLLGIAALSISFSAWRIFVRKSRLQINSDKIHFPTVTGSNLERHEFEFPRDFAGDYNLLFVPIPTTSPVDCRYLDPARAGT